MNTKFYVNKTGFNYCIYNFEELSKAYGSKDKRPIVHGHNYEVNFEGADFSSFAIKEKLSEYYNYFLGNDKSKWANHVEACKFLEFKNVYSGIDVRLYSDLLNLKYDFVISPNSDPAQIKLKFDYVNEIEIRNKELVIKTSIGEIIEKTPVTYQIINEKRVNVDCEYVIKNNSVSFKFPKGYDKNYELIIDPVVIVASYSGSSVFSHADASTYDSKGNIYIAGYASIGYPTTMGAFQLFNGGDNDIFVSAFNSNGTAKLFSTYLGGIGFEMAKDISVSGNEIVLLGGSESQDYPTTTNAFDLSFNGKYDLILSKLNITGSNLIASTFIGGTDNEDFDQFNFYEITSEMVIDKQKNIYVVSNTASSDFPVTSGALSSLLSGTGDAVVFKIDSTLNKLIWSTYLGGSDRENGNNIRLDGKGGVFVSGTTGSADFPTTSGAFNPITNSPTYSEIFISHINSNGTALIASTFLGTSTYDESFIMDVDASNNVYIGGRIQTVSPSPIFFTPTTGVYSSNSSNSFYKLDSSLSNLYFKTLFGPVGYYKSYFYYTAINVDSCGIIYLSGWTWWGQTTTPDNFMPYAGGATDMYMIIINPNFSSVRFASYYGGNGNSPTGFANIGESAWGKSHFDDKGILYQAVSAPQNFPTTPGAYCSGYSNSTTTPRIYNDAFMKVDFQTYLNANSSIGSNVIACPPPFTSHFTSTTNTGTIFWDFGDGNTSTKDTTHIYTNPGTYSVSLIITDTNTCQKIMTIKSLLNVINPTTFDLGEDLYKCPNLPVLIQPAVSAVSYSWSSGETTQNILVNQTGTYTLTIFNGGCYTSDEVTVLEGENGTKEKFPNVITPNGDNINDVIDLKKYHFGEMEFILYDRWGKEHYRTTDINEPIKFEGLIDGTYFYVINYQSNCDGKHATDKGYITILK